MNLTDTVSIKKFSKQEALELTRLNITDDLKREKDLEGLTPLTCIKFNNGIWEEYKFRKLKDTVKIGTASNSDIEVLEDYTESLQVTLHAFGHQWYIVEAGIFNNLKVNGIRTRQTLLNPYRTSVIELGSVPIILKTPENPLPGNPTSPRFSITTADGKKSIFGFDQTILIGSHSFCDIQLEGEVFSAAVSSLYGNLYLHPLFHTTPVFVDGEDERELLPLNDKSEIVIGDNKLSVRILEEPSEKAPFQADIFDFDLCMLEMDEESGHMEKHILPEPGTKVKFGRSPESCIPINSLNVSREQAKARVHTNNIVLWDNYSRNCTFVNDLRTRGKVEIHPGDIVRFADMTYLLAYSIHEKNPWT